MEKREEYGKPRREETGKGFVRKEGGGKKNLQRWKRKRE